LTPNQAAWLRLSDERDTWLRRLDRAWRDGRAAGLEAGYRAGYARAVAEWKVTAGGLELGGPTFAQLDRRRYPPGGRASWILPRPEAPP
jgi:hypothetical protein